MSFIGDLLRRAMGTDDAGRVARAGELALAEAERLWRLDVYDPRHDDHSARAEHSRKVIDRILIESGWTWEVPYLGDGQVEWCGLFAATCWRAAGLDPRWPATFWASTIRLDTWGRGRPWNGKPAGSAKGRVMLELGASSRPLPRGAIRPGDVVVVGPSGPGAHITIATGYDERTGIVGTISGNGGGLGPDMRRRQGIVRADFKIGGPGYCVRRVYRPAAGDLVERVGELR